MKQLLLVTFLLFCSFHGLAQLSTLDSLEQMLTQTEDTTRAEVMLEISKEYVGSDREKAIHYAEQAEQVYRAYENPKGVAYALKSIGLAYYVEAEYEQARAYWQKSLEVFTEIKDKKGEANILSNIGASYFNQGWDAKAIEFYLKSLKVAEDINDEQRMATVLSNIGAVYNNQQATRDKALEYYLRALPISEKLGYATGIGTISANIGEIYLATGNNDKALSYFQKALPILRNSDAEEKVAYCLNSMAKAYAQKGELNKAMEFHQEALTTATAISAKLEMTQSLLGIGSLYNQLGQPRQALASYQKAQALAQEIGAQYELKDAYLGLATSYNLLGAYKQAFDYQTQLLALKDTLYNTETSKKIENLQANYESEKKQAQIDLLTKDKELQEAALQRQKLAKNGLLVGLVFILALAFVLYRNYQNKAQANKLLTLKNQEINEQKEEIASQRDYLEETYNNLVNTQGQLVQAEKMASLGQLTAGVAHEINNPINFVSAGIDSLRTNFSDLMELLGGYLLLKPEEDNQLKLRKLEKLKKEIEAEELIEESEQLFKSIKNGASRTTEIVKSLRNFTRLDESSLKTADIHEGLDSTLVILSSQMKDRIKVIKKYGKLAPITCYPGQLNQVFMNILGNAVQAIKEEGTITIQTATKDDWAVIRIKDSGIGMSEEVKKRIFEPFYTTKDVGEGTGLGLSISYGIIEKHKGRIEVESTPGKGTEFILYLSLNLDEKEELEEDSSSEVEAVEA